MGKGDRREGGGGRRPEQGGGDTTDGRSPGGPGNPATPRAPRGRAPSRRALGRPPCPGRRGDPRTDLGQGGSRTRQGGDPWSSCRHPLAPARGGPAPSAKGAGLPFPPAHPAGPPRGAAAEITAPALPGPASVGCSLLGRARTSPASRMFKKSSFCTYSRRN